MGSFELPRGGRGGAPRGRPAGCRRPRHSGRRLGRGLRRTRPKRPPRDGQPARHLRPDLWRRRVGDHAGRPGPGPPLQPAQPALGNLRARGHRPRRLLRRPDRALRQLCGAPRAARVSRPRSLSVPLCNLRIDLEAIRRNAARLAELVAPTSLAVVVKANAYGHGLVPVAQALAGRVARFCVYELGEALALRDAGVTDPILVLGPVRREDLDAAHAADLAVTVWDLDFARRAAVTLRRRRTPLAIHAEVDTGVARLGFRPEQAPAAIAALRETPELMLEGCFTHLASSEDLDEGFTSLQHRRFTEAVDGVLPTGAIRHMAASAAAMMWPETRLDMVRVGIALYGVWPSHESRLFLQSRAIHSLHDGDPTAGLLEPAITWTTPIVALREIDNGEPVGYGCTWRAAHPTRIATLPLGYAEGLDRGLSNRGSVLVGGRRCPIVGRICMDMCMVDVTEVPDAHVGQQATLLGRDGAEEITADDLAAWCGTIAYEVLARLPLHLPRSYS
ncbi:alanine racemase [bacterium]|nr:MAG: alanine racemase [bacterium]